MFFVLKGRAAAALIILIALSALALTFSRGACPASAPAENARTVPIIMYHSILKDPARTGEYVASPEALRGDLEYLKSHGYEAVFVRELIDFTKNGAPLPKKPVVITFDDGFLNNMAYALPLIREYSMKAVLSPVGAYSDVYALSGDRNLYYAYMTWDDIRGAAESGLLEICSHSYDMHGRSPRLGASKKEGEDTKTYLHLFKDDVLKMQSLLREKSGVECIVYAYPFGAVSEGTAEALASCGIKAALTCREAANTVTRGDTAALFSLGRYNRSGLMSTGEFMAKAGIE